jgi:hypothetical protein
MPWYAATIFVSAFLLFLVQPLIARYILPWFGGSPSVWTTCMLFFQVTLLAGYAYADFVTRWLSRRNQVMLHSLLLVGAVALLPIIPPETWKPDGAEEPVTRILGLLLTTIGLPYFLLSTTGPLVQAWFAASFPGRSPYRLYALSNVGSLLALVAYPFVFESMFGTRPQAIYWSWGFGLFALLVFLTGIQSLRASAAPVVLPITVDADADEQSPAVYREGNWLSWIVLATIPSVLLLAITNQLCQESATIPFLWILPLGLYLMTFIICFDAPRWYHREFFFVATVLMTALVISLFRVATIWHVAVLPAYLFCASMLCHGELARQKPAAQKLTEYYLMISIGGALGGILVVLVAPLVFERFYELHFAMTAVLLAGVWSFYRESWMGIDRVYRLLAIVGMVLALRVVLSFNTYFSELRWAQIALTLAWIATGIAACVWMAKRGDEYRQLKDKSVKKLSALKKLFAVFAFVLWAVIATLMVVVIVRHDRNFENVVFAMQFVYAMLVVSILVGTDFDWPRHLMRLSVVGQTLLLVIAIGYFYVDMTTTTKGTLVLRRGFYGLNSVTAEDSMGNDQFGVGSVLTLYSGRIQHGFQYTGEKYKRVKTTYYGKKSGAGRVLANLPKRLQQQPIEMGVIGLGIGTMAMWGETGDRITFFEINPINLELADKYFTCLQDSPAETRVRLGDGRLMLEKEMKSPDFRPYDVFIVDAFTGDSIPRHLLTKECFELYSKALAKDGVLLIHVSHRHFELSRVIYPLADSIGREANTILSKIEKNADDFFEDVSEWIVITNNAELLANENYRRYVTGRTVNDPVLWTDDFGSMAQVLKFDD